MGAKVFGEQNPIYGETAVSWQTWSDGAGSVPTISGDTDWGKLKLDLSGEEGRSAVYDLGSEYTRKFTLTENRYGTGEDDATLQYRTSTSSFNQDDVSPAWTTYSVPFSINCRYIQIREITEATTFYYVDATSGDDDNTGLSIDQAWQTITKVNATAFSPGNHVLFKRGETFAGKLIPASNGDVDHMVVYGAYGTGNRPIIDGSADVALYIQIDVGRHHLRYENIDFAGSIGTSISYPVVRAQGNNLYFYNCIFRDSSASYGFYAADFDYDGSAIHHITVDSCLAYNNELSGIHIGSSAGTGGPHDCLIVNCTAYSNGKTGGYGNHGIYVRHGVIIDRCISYNNETAGLKVNCEGVQTSPYFPIVRNCTSYGNRYGIIVDNINSLIYNNLVYSNTYSAIDFSFDSDNSLVCFNTFVNCTAGNGLMEVASNPSGLIFKNNICVQDHAIYDKGFLSTVGLTLEEVIAANTFDYNIYFHNVLGDGHGFIDTINHTFAVWQSLGADPNSTLLVVDPDFVTRYTDLHPADAGNLKSLGVAIAGYEYDKDNNLRADPPTQGCYEEASA